MSRVVAIPSPPYCKTGFVIVPVLFSFSVYHYAPPAAQRFCSCEIKKKKKCKKFCRSLSG